MPDTKQAQSQTQDDSTDIKQPLGATRVTVDEVGERMERGEPFVFIDTRNPKAWAEADTKLPGAIHLAADEVVDHLDEIARDRAVITYCT